MTNPDDMADLLARAIPAANMDLDQLQIIRTDSGPVVMVLVDTDQYLAIGIQGPYTARELGAKRRELGDPEMWDGKDTQQGESTRITLGPRLTD
jgi:hypothetical protein